MIQRVLIVDDEPLARERLAALARQRAPEAMIREAGDGDAAVDLITAWSPDVVLLDVQMPGRNGFAVIEAVGAHRMPPTIFVTAHDEFALRAFDVAAIDYLLKPFDDERFDAAWRRARERSETNAVLAQAGALAALLDARRSNPTPNVTPSATPATAPTPPPATRATPRWADRIVVRHDQRTLVVPVSDIQWMESDGNYVVLHAGRERLQLRETLASLESRLDPDRFVRIHRGTLVALSAMKELQAWFGGDQVMILRDGTKLRVSRRFRAALAQRLAGVG